MESDGELQQLASTILNEVYQGNGHAFMSGDAMDIARYLQQLIARSNLELAEVAMQYMTPERAQDFRNHCQASFQNDPRLIQARDAIVKEQPNTNTGEKEL